MTKQEQLVGWLNDAQMMEEEIVRILESHVEDAKDFPEVQKMIQKHIEETASHGERIKQRLDTIGADVSGMKSTLGALMGKMMGPTTEIHDDKVIKNALLEYATEHFEMACYSSIKAAAEEVGDAETASLAQAIYDEEEAMGKKLEEAIPSLTQEYLNSLS